MGITIHFDTASNFHPYECNGPGKCIHCDRKSTKYHKVSKCALCEETNPRPKKKPNIFDNTTGKKE